MNYQRITPRARLGTTGLSVEHDLTAGDCCVIFPPDRVATVTVSVHWGSEFNAHYKIETTCNQADYVQESLDSDEPRHAVYWDNVYGDDFTMATQGSITICNAVTAIKVTSVNDASDTNPAQVINVCFVG